MKTVLVEFEIPEGYELADKKARKPRYGESYLSISGKVGTAVWHHTYSTYPILREVWEWPDWLKAKHIAMDKGGEWYAYSSTPHCGDDDWHGNGYINLALTTFTPPECTDWKESLRKNPHAD